MSQRDDMFGRTQGKGDKQRPTNLKKFRDNFPKTMGKKKGKLKQAFRHYVQLFL